MAKNVIMVGNYVPATVPNDLFVITAVSADATLDSLFAKAKTDAAIAIVFGPDPSVLGYITQLNAYSLSGQPWPVEVGFMVKKDDGSYRIDWLTQLFMNRGFYEIHLLNAAQDLWDNRMNPASPEELPFLERIVAELQSFGLSTVVEGCCGPLDLAQVLDEIKAKQASAAPTA